MTTYGPEYEVWTILFIWRQKWGTSALDFKLGQVWHSEARLIKFGVKWHIMVQYTFQWRVMTISGNISSCITNFVQFRRFLAGLTTLRSRCQVSVSWPDIVHNDTICPVITRYVHLLPHLMQRSSLWTILKNWFWIVYVRLSTTKRGRHCIIRPLMVQYGRI